MFPPFFPADHRVGPFPHRHLNPPQRRGAPKRLDLGAELHAAPYLPGAPPETPAAPAPRPEPALLIDLRAHPRFQPRQRSSGLRARLARAMIALALRLSQPRRA